MKKQKLFPSFKYDEFLQAIDRFKKLKLLVVGDVGLDEYIFGEVHRMSPEAPVPILDIREKKISLGLAANVAQNISSLGGQVKLFGVMGKDETSVKLKALLESLKIQSHFLLPDGTRQTTRKTRLISQKQHMIRLDDESTQNLSSALENQILKNFLQYVSLVDGVVLEDYAKGSLSEKLIKEIIKISHLNKKKVIVDPHIGTPTSHYLGADVLKPNFEEALILSHLKEEYQRKKKQEGIEAAQLNSVEAKNLLEKNENFADTKKTLEHIFCQKAGHSLVNNGFPSVIITQGKEGMSLFSKEDKESFFIPSLFSRNIFDVTGAGDTAIATLSLSWCSGLSLEESCFLANCASSVVIEKIGAAPCSSIELKKVLSLALPLAFKASPPRFFSSHSFEKSPLKKSFSSSKSSSEEDFA